MVFRRLEKLISPKGLAWAGRSFWAVTDQALFAGTNFLVSVLLARWMEPAAYGAFAIAYTIFLLFGTLHTALFTEPMLVYGPGRFRENFLGYHKVLLQGHWRFSTLGSLLFGFLGGGFLLLGNADLGLGFLGLVLAAPSVLYLWLVRRGTYAVFQPALAAWGGMLYLLTYGALALFLHAFGLLNALGVFASMAPAALVAGWWIERQLTRQANSSPSQKVQSQEVSRLHWEYGRWALLSGGLSWVPANLPLILLGAFGSLEDSALFRATYNLFMPVLHFQTALNSLFFPLISRDYPQDHNRAWRWVRAALGVHLVPALSYVVLAIWIGDIVGFLYGNQYPAASWLFSWLLPVPFLAAFSNALEAWSRGAERPKVVAEAYGLAALVAVSGGLALLWVGGLWGAALALVTSKMAMVACLYIRRAG